jgi:hypothetical protein
MSCSTINQSSQTDIYTGKRTYYTTFKVEHMNVSKLLNYIDQINQGTRYGIISINLESRTSYTYVHISSERKLNYEKITSWSYFSVKE